MSYYNRNKDRRSKSEKAVIQASSQGNLKKLKELLEYKYPNKIITIEREVYLALKYALLNCKSEIVDYIISIEEYHDDIKNDYLDTRGKGIIRKILSKRNKTREERIGMIIYMNSIFKTKSHMPTVIDITIDYCFAKYKSEMLLILLESEQKNARSKRKKIYHHIKEYIKEEEGRNITSTKEHFISRVKKLLRFNKIDILLND